MTLRMMEIINNLLHNEKNEIIEMTLWLISNTIFDKNDERNKIINSKIYTTIQKIITVKENDYRIMCMIGEFYKNLLYRSNHTVLSESFVNLF